jgi:glutaredoxin
MITVYGADWCEDTRRSLRHLRRLAVAHEYLNVDEDLDALDRAKSLNGGQRRTPIIDLGVGGPPLVEPDNDSLTGALIEIEMLTQEDAHERLGVQNVGDLERVPRTSASLMLILAAGRLRKPARSVMRIAGGLLTVSGLAGWSPAYHVAGVSSLDGPGDRPAEAHRRRWLGARRGGSTQADAVPGTAQAETDR